MPQDNQYHQDWYNKITFPNALSVLPIPTSDIYDGETRFYKANAEWSVLIEGFLRLLIQNTYWEGAENEANLGAEGIRKFLQGVKPVQPFPVSGQSECYTFQPSAPFIDYLPYDPYIGGTDYGAGYSSPPFVTGDNVPPYLLPFFYLSTDIITSFGSIPIPSIFQLPNFTFPTIKITVIGSGEVEVKLLKAPLGGYVIEKVGPNPPNVLDVLLDIIAPDIKIINLNLDVISVPPELGKIVNREVDIIAKFEHPNILAVFGLHDEAGVPYLVMEPVDGRDLNSLMTAGDHFTPQEVVVIIQQVLAGLRGCVRVSLKAREIFTPKVFSTETYNLKIFSYSIISVSSLPDLERQPIKRSENSLKQILWIRWITRHLNS